MCSVHSVIGLCVNVHSRFVCRKKSLVASAKYASYIKFLLNVLCIVYISFVLCTLIDSVQLFM